MKPWERQRYESLKAFDAFRKYRDMEPGKRSAEAVARKYGKSIPLVRRWRSRYRWVERASAWDDHLDTKRCDAEAAATAAEAARWAKRKLEHNAKLWERKCHLEEKLAAMFDFPLAQVQTKDGKTIIKPTRWTFADMAKLVETITRLERMALGLPTNKTEHTGPDGEQIVQPVVQPQVVKIILPENGRELKTEAKR